MTANTAADELGSDLSDYQAVGGTPAITAVVDRFYQLVIGDEQLAPYFAGTDLARLKRHQVLLLSQVLGGPAGYEGRDLEVAHAPLGITDDHFSRVGTHLVAALTEAGAPDDVIGRVGTVVGGLRPQIVTAGTGESARSS